MIQLIRFTAFSLLCLTSIHIQATTAIPANQSTLRIQYVTASEMGVPENKMKVRCNDLQLYTLAAPGGQNLAMCRNASIQKLFTEMESPLSVVDQSHLTVYIWEDIAGEYHVHARNRIQEDLHEFRKVEWRLHQEVATSTRKIVKNLIAYERSKDSLKEFFLQMAANDTQTLRYRDGQYFSWPDKKKLDWKKAYHVFVTDSEKTKNYMRTSLELTLSLMAGTIWYYQNFDFNAVDFDYPNLGDSFRTRFTSFDALRFDNNGAGINRKHIYPTGVGYYLFARSNGLNQMESLLASFVASTAWEYFIEFREVLSINDLIMTPVGGAVLGEVVHNLGRFFRGKTGLKNRVVGAAANPIEAFHKWLDNHQPKRTLREYDYGFERDIFASVEVYISRAQKTGNHIDEQRDHVFYGINADILNVDHGEGKTSELIYDTAITDLIVKLTGDQGSVDDFRMVAKTSLFVAKHFKNVQVDDDGRTEGYSIVIGPTQGLDVATTKDSQTAHYKDMIMNIQVLGNTVDVTRYYQHFRLRMTIDVFANFAMVRSYAFDGYRATGASMVGVQSNLINDSTYHGYGHSEVLKLSATVHKVEIGYRGQRDQFTMINSRSRFLESETTYLGISDARTSHDVSAKIQVSKTAALRCGVEVEKRSGVADGFSPLPRKETTRYCNFAYRF